MPEDEQAGQQGEAGKTFTQEDLDRIVGERVARERQKYSDYDDLKGAAQRLQEIEESKKSDLEKLSGERDTFKSQADQTATENLRLRVALQKQLPAELIDRLRGGTKEEMEADADTLLELVKPTPRLDGGARKSANGDDMDSIIRRAAGRTSLT